MPGSLSLLVMYTLTHTQEVCLLNACISHLKPNSNIRASGDSESLCWRHKAKDQKRSSFTEGANPRPLQGVFRSLEIPTTFAAKGLMSALSPGWMPTGIIACGNINLGKLKTTHILNNPKALDFLHGFCFWAASLQLAVIFWLLTFRTLGK